MRALAARRAAVVLVLAVALASCAETPPATAVVVEVYTDLAVPAQLDSVRIDYSTSSSAKTRTFPLEQDTTRGPLDPIVTFAIVPLTDRNADLVVRAVGSAGDKAVLWQSAEVTFTEGKVWLLRLDLTRRCLSQPCADQPASTCGPTTGRCDLAIRRTGLPPWAPPDQLGADAGPADSAIDRPLPDATMDLPQAQTDLLGPDAPYDQAPSPPDLAPSDMAPNPPPVDAAVDQSTPPPDAPVAPPPPPDAPVDQQPPPADAAPAPPDGPPPFTVVIPTNLSQPVFDVSADGSGVVLGRSGNDLGAYCFDGNTGALSALRILEGFPTDRGGRDVVIDVARAATAKVSIVGYQLLNRDARTAGFLWENRLAFLTADCTLMGPPRTADPSPTLAKLGLIRQPKLVAAADGRTALMYEDQEDGVFRLLTFSPAGADLAAANITTKQCSSGGNEFGLSMQAATADMVVSCFGQGMETHYRRFRHADGTSPDAAFRSLHIAKATFGSSGVGVGINHLGEIAASVMDAQDQWVVPLFDASGVLVAKQPLAAPLSYDGKVLPLRNGDFFIAQEGARARLARAGGNLTIFGGGTRAAVRVDGSDRLYWISNGKIIRNQL